MKEMGSEPNSSPSGKRSRDTEDEVYFDNFHSHKRYLSEIMASSLNGLTVGDPLSENLIESPVRSEGCYPRDEFSSQYSPMSEDSEESRYCDTPLNSSTAQHETLGNFTSPVSSHRYQKSLGSFSSVPATNAHTSLGCCLAATACSQPRQRGSDSEGRLPSSPSDICHSADLRRAALLRSVQMRAQPQSPPAFELPFGNVQETMHNMEDSEDQRCSYVKPLVDESEYHDSPQIQNMLLEECASMGLSASQSNQEKCYEVSNFNMKSAESGEELFGRNGLGRAGLMSSRRSILGGNATSN